MVLDAHRLFRFCVVGGLVAAFNFGLIWLFLHVLPRLAAVAAAYPPTVTLHFCLNRWWVFAAADAPAAGQVARGVLTWLACWLCTVGLTKLVLATLTPNVYFANAVAIPPTTLLGFLLMRGFVFRRVLPRDHAAGAGRGANLGP
jgi:putative flippase GtrA